MPDYSKAKIYAIRAPGTDDVYIGSTVKSLSARMANHRAHYKRWIDNSHNWMTSFLLMGFDNCYIELIENYPCESKEELNRREGEIVRSTPNCINHNQPGNSQAESVAKWREANKERDRAYNSNWVLENPDKVKAKRDRYVQNNPDKVKESQRKWREKKSQEKKDDFF